MDILVTAHSNSVERMLRLYLKALSDTNRACKDFVCAVQAGAARPIRRNAKMVNGMAAGVRAARSALQLSIKENGR